MIDRKELKSRAKLVLSRSYFTVLIACFLVSIVSGGGLGISSKKMQSLNFTQMPVVKMMAVLIIISVLVLIAVGVSIFVLSPLRVGLKRFMLDNARENASLNLLIFPFQNGYKNVVLTEFMKGLFIFLWSLLAVIPTVILCVLFGLYEKLQYLETAVSNGSFGAAAAFLGIAFLWLLLTLVFSIPAIIKELQYAMVSYIVAEEPDISWRTALAGSKEMMVGNKWEYVKLFFSFTLWYIAANLCCCVGNVLLAPYVEATFTELYLDISGKTPMRTEFNQA